MVEAIRNIRILYLEDEVTIRESVARMLRLLTDKLYTASNGQEALAFFSNTSDEHIDLIITDINMPQMDGLTFVEKLRAKGVDTPVIITTAFNEVEHLTKAIELKVERFAKKPIDMKSLMADIQKLAEAIATEKQLTQKRQQLANYQKAIHLTNYLIETNAQGEILEVSDSLREYMHRALKLDNIQNNLAQLFGEEIQQALLAQVCQFEVYTKDVFVEFNGEKFSLNLTAFGSTIEEGKVESISVIFKDMTHLVKAKDAEISRLYMDLVTGLPNRYALIKELNENRQNLALFVISIDAFKKYRHTYGYSFSDELLQEMARQLTHHWPETNPHQLYKLEEEFFAITSLRPQAFDLENVRTVAKTLTDYFEKLVLHIHGISLHLSITIGSSCDGETDLLLETMIALEAAYDRKQSYLCFKELKNPTEAYRKNIEMQNKVKQALDNDGIVPYFQAIVDASGQVVKYESLVRMMDCDEPGKVISPFFFLDVVQDSKHYERFTKRVIQKSVESAQALQAPISINLSFEDISNPEIIRYLEAILRESLPFPVTLELLESEGMQDLELTREFCRRMKSYGAQIAIDDFGSGYSNYDYFFEIPFDILKLDGSLIKRVHEFKGYLLLESIIGFAKQLNLTVIAEYVEDQSIFEKLHQLGVDYFQGYYFDHPKSLEQIVDLRQSKE